MIKYYLIDPPEGHKYGFPKMMSEEDYKNQHLKSLSQWCIDNGYPKEVVEEHGDVFFIKSTGPIVNPKLKKHLKILHVQFLIHIIDKLFRLKS